MAVDLPALLRPTKATSGNSGAGNWLSRLAVVRKRALWVQDKASRTAGSVGISEFWFRLSARVFMEHCKIDGFTRFDLFSPSGRPA